MDTTRINFWMVGITMIFAGSVLMYLENYRNSQLIFVIVYLLIFFGWITLFMHITKGTIVDAKKIPFSEDRVKSLQQGTVKFFAYTGMVGIIFGNIFFMLHLARNRRNEILQDSPTKITVAEINGIETSQGRGGTYYHAIFLYKTADGQSIRYSWSENEGDFFEGQKYEIRYSVEYPQMFKILDRMP